MNITLSKYDSNADVFQYYNIDHDNVTYGSYYLKGQSKKHIRRWTHTLQELGWTSVDRYVKHLKTLGYKEVPKYEGGRQSEAAAVS